MILFASASETMCADVLLVHVIHSRATASKLSMGQELFPYAAELFSIGKLRQASLSFGFCSVLLAEDFVVERRGVGGCRG